MNKEDIEEADKKTGYQVWGAVLFVMLLIAYVAVKRVCKEIEYWKCPICKIRDQQAAK